jgi:hypothetical protein
MLSKTFWKLLSISLSLKGNRSKQKKKKEKRDLEAIQMVKGFIETNNGYS